MIKMNTLNSRSGGSQETVHNYVKLNSTVVSATSREKYDVYEYTVDPPLPFQPGDILGVLQPDNEDSRLQIDYDTAGDSMYYSTRSGDNSLILLGVMFRQ